MLILIDRETNIIRAHDVKVMVRVARMSDAILVRIHTYEERHNKLRGNATAG